MSDDESIPKRVGRAVKAAAEDAADAAVDAAKERIAKYVPPLVRSTKIPLPRMAPSRGCAPASCAPQSCAPPGPCGPWR